MTSSVCRPATWSRPTADFFDARDLYVQQAALTGESMPAEKEVRADGQAPPQVEEKSPLARDLVFLGTSVVSGTGIVRIVATGPHTAFGAIAARLADRPEETEFQRGLRRFGLLITRTVFFLVLFILVVRIAMHKDAFESFVFAVALAVGLTPEFLPMITSVTLGRGAIRMARNHVIVKHLPAIQNFGTIDVFCSDKTGTLTTGEMILDSSVDYLGHSSDRPLALAYINSKFETGIRSPLELAILKTERPDANDYLKCDEVPFDFERRRLSIAVKDNNSDNDSAGLLIVKGAPEGILELSTAYESAGQTLLLDTNAHHWPNQLDLRLSDFLRALALLSRQPAKISHRLVCRVPGHADACDFCHPHGGKSTEEPTQPTLGNHDYHDRSHRHRPSLFSLYQAFRIRSRCRPRSLCF